LEVWKVLVIPDICVWEKNRPANTIGLQIA